MTDRPIIFSAPMVRALLEGRKTQTRRVLKPQPPCDEETGRAFTGTFHGPEWYTSTAVDRHGEEVPGKEVFGIYGDDWGRRIPYAPGDRLYVREAHKLIDRHCDYRADWPEENQRLFKWRPSIHMPRWASRLTLTVTDVRVQRLQDISAADSIAEGVECETCAAMGQSACHGRGCFASIDAYRTLWNSLHGPAAWDANPWCVAVSFTVQHGNIDQLGGRNE